MSPAKRGDRFRGLQQCQGFADAWLESRRVLQTHRNMIVFVLKMSAKARGLATYVMLQASQAGTIGINGMFSLFQS